MSADDVLSAWLAGEVGLAPQALAFCDDPAVIGVPFALFSFLPGTSITRVLPVGYRGDAEAVRRVGEALIDALAGLHRVDPATPGLPKSSDASGFLARQLERWVGIRRSDRVRELPLFALWRLAAMVEGAYSLHCRGRDDSAYARGLELDVPRLLDEAAASLGVAAR